MYKSLDKKSINVMRINALIVGLITIIITSIISYLCLTNIKDEIIKSIVIIILVIVFVIVILDILAFPQVRYSRYKYLVTDERIEVKKGLFLITRSIIQIKRIQKIEISDGPIDRKFNLSNVNIYTAAGMVDIKFLNKKEAESISEEINELLKKNLELKNEN